nr:ribonuclease H-like domain-containing protein [Tanacetum cinerariifolium]
MLADAKLHVTFWAEAVNTTCYVQNRVLVNKSQNKTSYELVNSRASAIGFLRPFGCQVMILNTLDHLGKFDAKGDEGYFSGHSMSSKAFREFNKRTNKVEQNLHVDFLYNKLIEKGAGPNWLFDIDTLTNSMYYVPVVVAGTSSTNFSGIKDAASQDMKKDVSSLRYIALPNWFHKAHLEYSTSNDQDACNIDAPESSGNSNPTATSTNPSADQMETLIVETSIPTVSSHVLTACLDDSPGLKISLELQQIQPPGFQDPEFPDRVYKVEKAIEFEARMHEKFQMSAMGELNFFLGLQVLQKKDVIFLSQDKYVGDILKNFGYSNVRSANTPMDKEDPWGKDGPGKDVELHLYRSMIRSLMYLTASRPDIMFAVCACARHQVTRKECHMHAVKRIFRYLKGHPKLGLCPKLFLLLLRDDSQGEAFPTVPGLKAGQDRENIIKTSALPYDSTPMVTSLDADKGTQDLEISSLKARIQLLKDKDKRTVELSGDDAPIKGRSLETGEEAGVERSTERGSNDTEEMVNVLDAANILTSGVQAVSVPPAVEVSTVPVPTGSGLVPTASPIFTTASMIARDAEIARIHAEEELKMLIDGLDRNNELIAKYLQENHAGWKTKHFRGMTLEENREKFILVWNQIEDFVPMASKEEGKRVKRKGMKLEEGSAKKMKTSKNRVAPAEEVCTAEKLRINRGQRHINISQRRMTPYPIKGGL